MAHVCHLELYMDVMTGRTLKAPTKLLDLLKGIGPGLEKCIIHRTVMVLANSKVHEVELKDHGAILFGLPFLAYLDIWGDRISLLFSLCVYFLCIFLLYFLIVVLVFYKEGISSTAIGILWRCKEISRCVQSIDILHHLHIVSYAY